MTSASPASLTSPPPSADAQKRGMAARLRALFGDNPVLHKDMLIAMRSRGYAVVVALTFAAALLVAAVVHGSSEHAADDLRQYGDLYASGRAMLAFCVGGMLFLVSVFLTAAAATSIASERERGTLMLLTSTALSPLRIVVAKTSSAFLSALPFLAPMLVFLPLCKAYGDISLAALGLCGGALLMHALCCAAVGVGVSAVVPRARVAPLLALIIAGTLYVAFCVPITVALGLFVNFKDVHYLAQIIATGALFEVLVAAAAVLIGVGALSPKRTTWWPTHKKMLVLCLVGLPLAAAAATHLAGGPQRDLRETSNIVAGGVAAFTGVVLMLDILLCDLRAVDGRHALRAAWLNTLLLCTGMTGFYLMPLASNMPHRLTAWGLHPASIVVLAAYIACVATGCALVARLVRHPLARIAVASACVGAHLIVPLLYHAIEARMSLPDSVVADVNPLLQIDAIERGDGHPLLAVVAFVVCCAAFSLFARGRKR